MELDQYKVLELAQQMDPTPIWNAVNQFSAGGAMDMAGSAASPQGLAPTEGMGFGSVFGMGPAPMKQPNFGAMANPAMFQQQGPQVGPAPAAQPRAPGQVQMPLTQKPQAAPKPTLAQLLGGK